MNEYPLYLFYNRLSYLSNFISRIEFSIEEKYWEKKSFNKLRKKVEHLAGKIALGSIKDEAVGEVISSLEVEYTLLWTITPKSVDDYET